MFTAVDLRLTGLIVVIHLLYFIDIISNISYNLLQNLLFFLPENTKISYFLDFFKSYILIEVDFDHCTYHHFRHQICNISIILWSFCSSGLPKVYIWRQYLQKVTKRVYSVLIPVLILAVELTSCPSAKTTGV